MPRKEGEAMNQTELNVLGIHDNNPTFCVLLFLSDSSHSASYPTGITKHKSLDIQG